jgi:hypothetical protein
MREVTAAAQRLAKYRWRVASDKERSEHARRMAQARWAGNGDADVDDNVTQDIAAVAASKLLKVRR